MDHKVIFSNKSIKDLEYIADYIKYVLKNPKAADDFIDKVYNKLSMIIDNPECRPLVSDNILHAKGIRIFKINNYLLIYKIDNINNIVYVIRILYKGRDWRSVLKEELN